ncbi:hypothetical protein OAE36_00025 [bacterium]|nr:hypothetical protein [bacterium]
MKTLNRFYEAKRSWGSEYVVLVVPQYYMVKLLKINKFAKGGLQYHHLKNECGLVLHGSLQVTILKDGVYTTKTLVKNNIFHFEPGLIHQESAEEDTIILEMSTPHFNDRVRLDHEDLPENTLLSTEINDVLYLDSLKDVNSIRSYGFKEISAESIPFLHYISF